MVTGDTNSAALSLVWSHKSKNVPLASNIIRYYLVCQIYKAEMALKKTNTSDWKLITQKLEVLKAHSSKFLINS